MSPTQLLYSLHTAATGWAEALLTSPGYSMDRTSQCGGKGKKGEGQEGEQKEGEDGAKGLQGEDGGMQRQCGTV